MLALALSAWVPGLTPGPEDDNTKWFQTAALFGALYIVALGTGVSVPVLLCCYPAMHATCRSLSSRYHSLHELNGCWVCAGHQAQRVRLWRRPI